ncbi:ABC transporter permease [Fulvivirga sediminis]|uniref:ABC transporter permease n=1 Tax=Fulvivirga sediminis TaxID=2803949 RepID=A0A937K2F8_9BACT|nr:ABC transporter permease [Fulvivirga sediminis]MBL3658330.1 ABC transporter permease [Fulvivirga sediminis]
MIRNYFISAVRYFLRHKRFTFLNITGLAIGFAFSILLILFVWQESGYDQFHEKKDRLARVTMEYVYSGKHSYHAVTGSIVAPTLYREFPEVESVIRFDNSPRTVKYQHKLFKEEAFLHADSTLFDMFSFHLLKGNPAKALNAPNKVLLTPAMVMKYFGDENPIGQSIKVDNRDYEVTGIVEEAPENSQIKYDFIGSFSSLNAYKNELWSSANYITYLLLKNESDFDGLQQKITGYMDGQRTALGFSDGNYLTFNLEQFSDVHLHSKLSGLEPNFNITYVYLFSVVAALILLIACINYINLSTARAVERGTEVGVRKVMGASRSQLLMQYISEAIICVFIAAVLAIAIATALQPFFNVILERNYSISILLSVKPFFIIVAVLLIISLMAGMYPAVVLTRLVPSKTLKGTVKSSAAGIRLRNGLMVFQFIVSAGLIICALVIYEQLHFIQNTDLGYSREHVIVLPINNDAVKKYDLIKSNFEQLSSVESITMAYETPTKIDWGDGFTTNDGRDVMTAANPVEYNYLNTLKIQLLAGRDFTEQDQKRMVLSSTDSVSALEMPVIINKEAASALGWSPEEAIGKRIDFKSDNTVIIGVMGDFHFTPLHEKVGPLVLFLNDSYNEMMLRVSGDDMGQALSLISNKWSEILPDLPYSPTFLDDEYNALYANDRKLGELFLFFTSLAVFLGCLGLLGLSALAISHRMKEIGIRKVLGASLMQIAGLLSADFMKLILVAYAVAIPLSWYLMDRWLKEFAYHIDMPWEVFFFSGFVLVLVSLITISTQTIHAALKNPADVIRND